MLYVTERPLEHSMHNLKVKTEDASSSAAAV